MAASCSSGMGVFLAMVVVLVTLSGQGLGQTSLQGTACQIVQPNSGCTCGVVEESQRISEVYTCNGLPGSLIVPPLGTYDDLITRLIISNTFISFIQPNAFAGLKIRGLYMEGIQLNNTDSNAFAGLDIYLEVLKLSHNNLVSVTEGVFDGLFTLKELHLDNNKLTTLRARWFEGLTNLRYLFLDHNAISYVEPDALSQMQVLTWLKLHNNVLTDVPASTYSKSTSLGQLDLKHNQIQTVHPQAFKGMSYLHTLDMSNNSISTLDVATFSGVAALKRLFLSENKLYDIPDSLFNDTRVLDVLDLASNFLTSFRKEVFGDIQMNADGTAKSLLLRILFLNNNTIATIPNSPFVNLNHLEILFLQDNLIKELPYNNFAGLSELSELHLDGNPIEILTYGIFDQVGNLKRLKLANNKIREVQPSPFDAVRNLVILDLRNNLIPKVTRDWFTTSSGSLQELDLRDNKIEFIETGTFGTLNNLKTLDLANNLITEVADFTFENNTELRKLSLSRNPVKELGPNTFRGLRKLETLDMDRTCVQQIFDDQFDDAWELAELNLARSPITYLHGNSFRGLKNLRTLDLSYNNLTQMHRDAFGHLLGLKELFLHHSRMSSFMAHDILLSSHNLTTIDLSFNLITYLMESDIRKMTHLGQLVLMGNPLECRCDMVFLRTLDSLDHSTAVCHTPVQNPAPLAACFNAPAACQGLHERTPENDRKCNENPLATDPLIVNPPTDTEDYSQCIELTTTVAPTTVEVTTQATTTIPPVPPLTRLETIPGERTINVSWSAVEHPFIFGYRLLYRRFAFNDTGSKLIRGAAESNYVLTNLKPSEYYVVCILIVTQDFEGYVEYHHRECDEARTLGAPTPAPVLPVIDPTARNLVPITIKEETFPVIPIAVACGVAVIIIIVIIVLTVVVQSMRSRQNQMRKLEEEQTASSMSLRQKLGMWATTFSYTGANNEQMAEQTTLTWNIYNSDDYARASTIQKDEVLKTPDIIVENGSAPYDTTKIY